MHGARAKRGMGEGVGRKGKVLPCPSPCH